MSCGLSPPSASGHLEPYGATISLWAGEQPLDPVPFLQALLDGTASSCARAGAILIAHLKCVLRAGEGRLFCNLTSQRWGATCRGDALPAIPPGGQARLDLVVLVYGLSADQIDEIVSGQLDSLLGPGQGRWSGGRSSHAPIP